MTQFEKTEAVKAALQAFKNAFEALVPRKSVELRKSPIYLAIQRQLRRSDLQDVSPEDVLYEVWLCGVQTVERGNHIKKLDGWMYSVALRVIAKEIGKRSKERKVLVTCDPMTDEQITTAIGSDGNSDKDIPDSTLLQYQRVREAIEQLNQQQQDILGFTILDDWSYSDIAEYQVQEGKPAAELTALRQQRSRALKKLKEVYQRLP